MGRGHQHQPLECATRKTSLKQVLSKVQNKRFTDEHFTDEAAPADEDVRGAHGNRVPATSAVTGR